MLRANLTGLGDEISSLVDLLCYRAQQNPLAIAYTFLLDGEKEAQSLTYQDLDIQARAIACQLQDFAEPGERALLLYPSGVEFIAAFFGCLYAGVIAIPMDTPRANQSLDRLSKIVLDAMATVALTTQSLLPQLRGRGSENPSILSLYWLTTDNLQSELAAGWQKQDFHNDSLAFLQYTSGSTGSPKGVMVSHGNLLHNEKMIKHAFHHHDETVGVGWLPQYHDMGLIGNILQPLYLGRPSILMSPVAFIQKPVRWLSVISQYKATSSGGPNFAYELCARKITPEQKAELDLSSWQVAFNGAEPINAEVLKKFASAFAECGFNKDAFLPCYGLAESTLFVCGNLRSGGPLVKTFQTTELKNNRAVLTDNNITDNRQLVSCSNSFEQKIVIVDPELLRECSPNQIGEIWISGPSVAHGYWNNGEATETTFKARLKEHSETFLRSGDLGFIDDGQLFVTGRLKDLIIIRGRNYYPQDIELTVEQSHPALREHSSAAFAVNIDGEEKLVVLAEVDRQFMRQDRLRQSSRKDGECPPDNADNVISAIRQAVPAQHELQIYSVVLLKTGSIPKTSSGKIQRQKCRVLYENNNLSMLGIWESIALGNSASPLERMPILATNPALDNTEEMLLNYLKNQVGHLLDFKPDQIIDRKTQLSTLGFDSLSTMELHVAIERDLRVTFLASKLLENPTLEEILFELINKSSLDNFLQIKPDASKNLNNGLLTGKSDLQTPRPRGVLASLVLTLFGVMSRLIWNVQISGVNNIPLTGPFILCPNHESHLDGMWIMSCLPSTLRDQCCCLAKKEHFHTAIGRMFASLVGAIPTDRLADSLPALNAGVSVLKEFRPLLIHPEGTRSRTGKLLPFRRGVAKLAFATNAPVIPIRICGTGVIYPAHKLCPKLFDLSRLGRYDLQIIFGSPIYPNHKLQNLASEILFTEQLQNAVASLVNNENEDVFNQSPPGFELPD
jgi:1-acyl-sn-glycerol-3-phosphate acyltransferase